MALDRKYFKLGCFGCLGLGALVTLAVLVLAGVAYFTARPQKVEERVLTAEVPPEVREGELAGGRIVLAVREAELRIEPVGPGEPIRVEGRYDVHAFSLESEVVPQSADKAGWAYRVTFERAARSGAFAGLVSLVRGTTSIVRVYLPTDTPFDLELEMREGGAVVRLAGLWLRTAEIDFASGGFEMSVDEPLREPMDRLSIHTARGGSLLNGLGNASPRRLDVSYSMGAIDMDLSGRWVGDSEITITGGTGGGVVHLPSAVALQGLRHRGVRDRGDPANRMPTLSFEVSTGVGRLEFAP